MSISIELQADKIEAMFVQSARGMTSSDGSVTFHGLAHATLFFADRPQRGVGHMHPRKFVLFAIRLALPFSVGICSPPV
jgi:hypothetical protein